MSAPLRDAYDVVVVGAGPAGCAAAAVAAREGLSTLLVERDEAPRFKIGESLMPETYDALVRMGALEKLKESNFVEKHSVQFYARNGRASAPFYFKDEVPEERARTWQVRRADFDQMLFECARERGAECLRGLSVHDVVRDGAQVTGVCLRDKEGCEAEVSLKVFIDGSGQSTVLGRHFDLGKKDYDLRHASIFTWFKGAWRDEGVDEGATLILQTVPEGDSWFWYIPLPDDVVSIGVVGPAAAMKRSGKLPHEVFFEETRRCPEIRRRLEGAVQCRPVDMVRDFSYQFERMAGDGWVLVGDAFSFIDPVYSSGVFLALHAGVMAADTAVLAIAEGDLSGERIGSFRGRLERGISAVLGLVRSFYDPEFSFGRFLKKHPEHQSAVTRVLIGDVFETDFSAMYRDMNAMLAAAREETAAGSVPTAG